MREFKLAKNCAGGYKSGSFRLRSSKMKRYGVPKAYTFGCRMDGPGNFTCAPVPYELTSMPSFFSTACASMLRFWLLAHTIAWRSFIQPLLWDNISYLLPLSLSLQSNSLISVSPISQFTHHTYFVCIVALTIALLCSDRRPTPHTFTIKTDYYPEISLSFTAFSANKQALLILCRPPNPPHKLLISFWTFPSPVSEKPCPLADRIPERLGLSPEYPSGNYYCWLAASLPHDCRCSDHRHSQVFFACWMRPVSELPLCNLKKYVPKAAIPDDDNFFFPVGRGEFSG